MNAMNSILLPDEKIRLRKMGLVALCLMVVGLVFFFRVRSYHSGLERETTDIAGGIAAARQQVKEAGLELGRWSRAVEDIASVKTQRLFRKDSAVQDIRLALQDILDRSGAKAGDIDFSYEQAERKRLGKVTVAFGFSGSYEAMKRLLGTIEADPRLLTVERLDFPGNWNGNGPMKIKFTLAGYHEL